MHFSEEGQNVLKGFRNVTYKPGVITIPTYDEDGNLDTFEKRKITHPVVTIFDSLQSDYKSINSVKGTIGNENHFNFGELLKLDDRHTKKRQNYFKR